MLIDEFNYSHLPILAFKYHLAVIKEGTMNIILCVLMRYVVTHYKQIYKEKPRG